MKNLFFIALALIAMHQVSSAQGVKPKQDFVEVYNAEGKFSKQVVFDYYEKVDDMPEFPGGAEALNKYIKDNLHYPEEAKANKISGTVMMRFILSPNGNVMNLKTLSAPAGGNLLEKETQRLVQRMPRWKPGKLEGKPVYMEVVIPFEFKLD